VIDCAPPITDCAPAATAFLHPDAAGHYAPVFPGWGHHHYPISTSVDSAQFYFDQGLSLYYSFHLSEAAASFKEATVKDSGCAMAYWGEALAMGPFYNSTYTYRMPREVLPVLDRMNELSASATAKEREMIAALDRRYSTDISDRRRSQLNQAWSSAMAVLTRKFPDDNDIAALYIDGMMTQHAWDLWDPQGRPKPWTPALVSLCEKILARDPDHPAALHYHIHLLEASLHPEATLESANRLKDMMPGVPHMVHMASHSYQRTGLYAKGVSINDAANAAQTNYSELAPQLHLHPTVIHYDAVEAFCAMNAGMYEKAMTSALRCRSAILSRPGVPNANAQYLSMMPVFVQLRLGKWDAVLDERLPDRTWVFASLLGDFARGMAYLRTGKMAEASACLDSIRSHQNEPFLAAPIPPSNTPVKVAAVAEEILAGEILFAAGKPNAALTAFQHAIDSEDALTCLEPKDWALPARQYAGACCLKLGRVGEAEKLYREDLVQNPGNGWALLGLARTAEAQHKDAASSDYLTRAKATFAKAEEMPGASAY
jgi:tetratricopeptide (TPR) repeat protein